MFNGVIYYLCKKKGEMLFLYNLYIWIKYFLFNCKNIKWCFIMCIFFDKKKEICIWYVNSFFCDRVGFVVIKDYKFYKMWLRVDEFFLSEENF